MVLRHLKNVATLSLTDDNCIGCSKCTEVCPHGVFNIAEGKARIADKDLCMECGACALNCPFEAISVKAGTGCALAYIMGWLTRSEPNCGCGNGSCC